VTNAGTFVVQIDGAALTALQIIDNPVFVDNDPFTLASSSVSMSGAIRDDSLTTLAAVDGDAVPLRVGDVGGIWTAEIPNVIDSNNTSTATLGIGATFTGTATDVLEYSAVTINIDSDVDSAADGVQVQRSSDGTNWDLVNDYTFTASAGGIAIQIATSHQFFRIVYTNGGTGQATFRLQSILHHTTPITGTNRLSDAEDPDSSTTLTKAAIIAQAAGSGDFVPVQATAAGNLKASIEEVNGSIAGGGVEADALRVTVASDSTGLLSVDDNGGSLTVDNGGTFVVQEDGAALTALQIIDNPVKVDDAAFALTTDSVSMAGAIRDDTLSALGAVEGDAVPLRVGSTGALHVTGGGGGQEYTADDVTPATPTGSASLMERDDVLGGVTPIAGDWVHQFCNANGAMWTAIDGSVTVDGAEVENAAVAGNPNLSGGRFDSSARTLGNGDAGAIALNASGHIIADVSATTGGTHVDDAAFTAGTDDGVPTFAFFNDSTPDSVNEGDAGIVRMSANRNAYQTIRDAAGNERGVNVDASNNLNAILASNSGVDIGDVDVLSSALPTGAATSAGQLADGHNVTVDNASGGSAVNVQDGGNSLTVDNGGTFVVQEDGAALTALQLIDNPIVAHDAAATGSTGVNMAGARASNSVEGITQVANADATRLTADLNGCLVTRNGTTLEELLSANQTNTDGSEDAVTNFPAGGAGVHNYITSVTVSNSSASTFGTVDLVDGTGGTVIWTFPAPGSGGATHNFDPPLKQATANTQLFFDPSAAISTITISINGFQAQG